jgi:hypothetical protein
VDETATDSANLFEPAPSGAGSFFCRRRSPGKIALVHFHAPSIAPGVIAFIWAIALGGYLFFFLVATGSDRAFAFVIAVVAAAGIWLFVRTRGRDVVGE